MAVQLYLNTPEASAKIIPSNLEVNCSQQVARTSGLYGLPDLVYR
ncbi:MAG: hypothetical protein QNJ33_16690 [Crocosphaera sp.]|nr:hypothetical protein [Crocosphaera sp.]